MRVRKLRARLEIPKPPRPEPEPRKVPRLAAPRLAAEAAPTITLPVEPPKIEAPPAAPAPKLETAVASTLRPGRRVVQSAGFEGSPVQADTPAKTARLQVGAFQGLSGAPGGSAGAGRKAEVRQTGFGEALASHSDGKPGPGVASGGFGSAVAASGGETSKVTAPAGFAQVHAEKAEAQAPMTEAPAAATPVEVLSKPRPVYTEEARARRIEGDVALETLFHADGRAEVLRVVRGLGYGLDEAAAEAVRAIEFRPARRGGAPVDATLSVSVAFRLAY